MPVVGGGGRGATKGVKVCNWCKPHQRHTHTHNHCKHMALSSSKFYGTMWSMTWRSMGSANAGALFHGRHRACVYCGDPATSMDHFRPVIGPGGLPTGFGADEWNMVPACSTCNSSKGNQDWYTFMTRTTGKAPLARGVPPNVNNWRIAKLRTFANNGANAALRWEVRSHAPKVKLIQQGLQRFCERHAREMDSFRKDAWETKGQRRAARARKACRAKLPRHRMLTRSKSR